MVQAAAWKAKDIAGPGDVRGHLRGVLDRSDEAMVAEQGECVPNVSSNVLPCKARSVVLFFTFLSCSKSALYHLCRGLKYANASDIMRTIVAALPPI